MKTLWHARSAASLAIICSLVGGISPIIAAPASISLKRSGPWEINYDDQSCHLIAPFGASQDEVLLRFSRFEHGDSFSLSLFGQPFASTVRDVELTLDFGQGSGPVPVQGQAGTAGTRPVIMTRGSFYFTPPKPAKELRLKEAELRRMSATPTPIQVSPEREASITKVVVGVPKKATVALETGSMAAPMAAMRKCLDDLMRSWGYDPATIAALSRKPMPSDSPGKRLSYQDYPKTELTKGRSALVRFRLDVGADGKVSRCTILDATKGDEFGKRSCEVLMRRANFVPALDAAGKPTAAFFTSSIYWMIP